MPDLTLTIGIGAVALLVLVTLAWSVRRGKLTKAEGIGAGLGILGALAALVSLARGRGDPSTAAEDARRRQELADEAAAAKRRESERAIEARRKREHETPTDRWIEERERNRGGR